MPKTAKGLMAWDRVEARLVEAKVYWLATSGPGGRPRIRPVDGLWVDLALYVGGSPETRWIRDLEANPQVSVHLDGGYDVVILEGEAEHLVDGVDHDLAVRLAAASNAKYPEYGMKASDYEEPGVRVIRPLVAFAWASFPKDVTRFRFSSDEA
jgi:nitroimidazol reductase NimA-like FMN-containing flavoprotein (pyridoxamine 5'-phosphate oxidase superfamily)